MRKAVLFFVLLSCSISFAGTKKPFEFTNPMGQARKVPFASTTESFPRDGGHHPYHYSKEQIAEKRKDKKAVEQTLKAADAELMVRLPKGKIRSLIKPYVGFEMTRCPHCKKLYQYGITLWKWTVDDPERIRCTSCDMLFPNEQYPADKTVTIIGPDGKGVDYPYHQDSDGVRYFYCCKIQQIALNKIAHTGMLYVVDAYAATADIKYAKALAVILARLAEIYPSMPFHGPGGGYGETSTGYVERFYAPDPPHEYMSGKWYNTAYSELYYTEKQAVAYDTIYNSGVLEEVSAELGYDIKKIIERDLLYAATERTLELPHILDNYDPHAVSGIAAIGRCLNDPALIRGALLWQEELLKNTILRDGIWYEGSFSYHFMSASGVSRAIETLYGYSDPGNYSGDDRIDDFDTYSYFPVLKHFYLSPLEMHWPDGSLVFSGDLTLGWIDRDIREWNYYYEKVLEHYSGSIDKRWKKQDNKDWFERGKDKSLLKETVGLAFLKSGADENTSQLVLSFGASAAHHHFDKLGINFYAFGDEMLSERGYTYTKLRSFATATASHNTVVVDGKVQPYSRGSDLKCLIINNKKTGKPSPVQFCQVEGSDIYPQTSKSGIYSRSVAMVSVGNDNVYLVDLFKVKGGKQHDYFLHGSCDNEMKAEVSLPMQKAKGNLQDITDFQVSDKYSSTEPIELIEKGNSLHGNFDVTFNYIDPERKDKKLRAYFRMNSPVEVISGQASTIRKAKEQDSDLAKSKTSAICIRSKSGDTTYASILAPSKNKLVIESVSRLDIDPKASVVGFKVETDSYIDYILIGSDTAGKVNVSVHGNQRIVFEGTFGFARFRKRFLFKPRLEEIVTSDTKMFIVDGKDCSSGVSFAGKVTALGGDILRRTESYFETTTVLPTDKALENQVVIISRTDGVSDVYVIGRVETIQGGSRIYLRDGTTMVEIENRVYQVDLRNKIIETDLPLKRAICSEWEKGKRVKVAGHTFTIKEVLNTLRPRTFETPARIVVEEDKGLSDVKAGDTLEIYSNIEGDTWKINAIRTESF